MKHPDPHIHTYTYTYKSVKSVQSVKIQRESRKVCSTDWHLCADLFPFPFMIATNARTREGVGMRRAKRMIDCDDHHRSFLLALWLFRPLNDRRGVV